MESQTTVSESNVPAYDWTAITDSLMRLLRLKTTPIGMKLFETVAEMEAVPRIRRPTSIHTADQIVAQAARLGWTVGVTASDLVISQCSAVLGLSPQDAEWRKGTFMSGVWYATPVDAAGHQNALHFVPAGRYSAMAVSPLAAARLNPPDICLIYGTPGQMILFINGLQYEGYKPFQWTVVGETACADSWGRALATGQPSLSLPCFAERRFGGVQDDEMLMALPPDQLVKAIDGLEKLARNGLRYPIPPYGISADARDGLRAAYPELF